jgi:integrase
MPTPFRRSPPSRSGSLRSHPKVVSERLGHATTGITLDVYSHVQPELDAHAATAVAELFGDNNKGTKAARRG